MELGENRSGERGSERAHVSDVNPDVSIDRWLHGELDQE